MAKSGTKKPAKKAPAKQATKRALSPKQAAARNVVDKKRIETEAAKVKRIREEAEAAARDMEVTSAEAWAEETEIPEGKKLLLPSGKVCLAYNPGIMAFYEAGAIPNALMPLVQEALESDERLDPKKAEALAQDPEMLGQIMEFANAAMLKCVLEPEVLPVPEKESDRKKGKLYVDRILIVDRMFILQWVVGGTSDIERFHLESALAVEPVEQVEDVVDETK